MSYAFVAGVAFVAFGLVGVRYAPAIVAAQHRRGMTPVEADELDGDDRVRVTRATAAVAVLVGLATLAFAVAR